MPPERYLRYFLPSSLFHTQRTKQILNVNPTVEQARPPLDKVNVSVFSYTPQSVREATYDNVESIFACKVDEPNSWINIDGIRKEDVEKVCAHFGIHPLL